MKKITILLVIIFTFLFSTTSWGEWSYVDTTEDGSRYYYDKDGLRKGGKFLYFWELVDYIKPEKDGTFSITRYTELDCSTFRYKILKSLVHNKSMGEGKETEKWTPTWEWYSVKPNTSKEFMLNKVCEEHQ